MWRRSIRKVQPASSHLSLCPLKSLTAVSHLFRASLIALLSLSECCANAGHLAKLKLLITGVKTFPLWFSVTNGQPQPHSGFRLCPQALFISLGGNLVSLLLAEPHLRHGPLPLPFDEAVCLSSFKPLFQSNFCSVRFSFLMLLTKMALEFPSA